MAEGAQYRVGFWIGAASVFMPIILSPIVSAFNGEICPRAIVRLFIPALSLYCFCCWMSFKQEDRKYTAEDLILFVITSFLMQMLFPVFVIGSPYFIWKYWKERKYA